MGMRTSVSVDALPGRADSRLRHFRTLLLIIGVLIAAAITTAPALTAQQPGAAPAPKSATPAPVVQVAEFTPVAPYNSFGYAVAMDGDIAVVGAPGVFLNLGLSSVGWVYIFVKTAGNWSLQASIQEPDYGLGFGSPVAINGGTVVVGDSGAAGAVYVYTQTGNTWSQQARLTAADGVSGDNFGSSVAVEGGAIVVGAPGRNNLIGAAYIFTQTGGTWSQQAELTAPDGATYDSFGSAVALSGGTTVITAPLHNHRTGAMYVFTQTGAQWSQQAELTPPDALANDFFGSSVALSGNTAVVGDTVKNTGRGAVYVYTRTSGTWGPPSELGASDAQANDLFGYSVAFSGGNVAVGAPYHNQSTGAVYLFTPAGAGWNQQAEVTASDAAPYDSFGQAIALNGGVMLVGAGPGDGTPEYAAAYVFQLPIAPPLNSANLVAGAIAPGEIITLLPNLGPATGLIGSPDTNGLLPTELGGLQVFFDGVAAPIIYAQQQQINVQAPFELVNPTTQVHIEYNGSATWPSTVTVQPAAPGIFHAISSETPQALLMNQDGTWNSASNPAPAGSVVSLWATGGGATNPPGITGGFTPLTSLTPLALAVTVTLGSAPIPATVTYFGVAPTLSTGVFQVNFQIPAGISSGSNIPVSIIVGSAKSTDPAVGTTIALK